MNREDIRQIVDGMSTVASLVTNYYLELKKLGHSDENAIKLAMDYQRTILTMNTNNEQ